MSRAIINKLTPTAVPTLDWPLMQNNITRADLDAVIEYLRQDSPMLTQSGQVRLFEQEWSAWLGVKHSVFVNSGASANLLTMTALRELSGARMSTHGGGNIRPNDANLYETLRMLRSHGMVREATSEAVKQGYRERHPDLNPDFIFAFPAYNVRSTEINAVLGRSQLKRLDANNVRRRENLRLFLDNLDPKKYRTDFAVEGSCNYAFTLVLQRPDPAFSAKVEQLLRQAKVEFRRGTSDGGNQLRQPYARKLIGDREFEKYPQVNHVHFFGYYLGNFPELEHEKIFALCRLLNELE